MFSEHGILEHSGQIAGIEVFGAFLEGVISKRDIILILYETYRVNPRIAQGGSDVPSAQVIGIVKHVGSKYSTRYEGIDPKYKTIGYAWSGTKKPSNHSVSHAPDAVALGEYWLRKNKVKPLEG